jgi:MscS family membrane protein
MKAGVVVLVFWALWAYVTVSSRTSRSARGPPQPGSAPSLLAIGGNFAKFSLVRPASPRSRCGLQRGGPPAARNRRIAIALAAQKTVENLFGSFSIGVDQPFNVGDFVRLGDIEGTVESIGLRSTRLRTVEHTLVTIPNGKLADRDIETFAPRQRIRLHHVLAVQHGTHSDRVRALRDALELRLRALPRLWPEHFDVRLTGVTESALRLTVTAWIETADPWEFREIRSPSCSSAEDAEAAGVPLTSPARTLELVSSPPSLPNDRSSHSPTDIRP